MEGDFLVFVMFVNFESDLNNIVDPDTHMGTIINFAPNIDIRAGNLTNTSIDINKDIDLTTNIKASRVLSQRTIILRLAHFSTSRPHEHRDRSSSRSLIEDWWLRGGGGW
jgi:hypothetical protein